MNHLTTNKTEHPVLYYVKKFIGKLTQQPGIYPIKYYKKGQRLRKSNQMLSEI